MGQTQPTSVFELPPDEIAELQQDVRADADAEIEAGMGVPHSRVREWLTKLGRGEKATVSST